MDSYINTEMIHTFLISLAIFYVVTPAKTDKLLQSASRRNRETEDHSPDQSGRLMVSPETDINEIFASVIKAIPGLREDSTVQDHCTGIPLQMYHKMVDSGRACRQHKDYRCYKACQFEVLGVSKDGIINLKRLMTHFDLFFIGQRPPSIEAIKRAAFECLFKKDGTETLSSRNCDRNNVALECMHKYYFEICKPGETIPELKHLLQ